MGVVRQRSGGFAEGTVIFASYFVFSLLPCLPNPDFNKHSVFAVVWQKNTFFLSKRE